MIETLLPIATFLAAMVMGLALAHGLEMPGKMRLEREYYYAVQTIYYPGFTLGGMTEPLAIITTASVLLIGGISEGRFWLVAGAVIALVLTQLLFWIVVQPVNRQWLGSVRLSGAAEHFFRTGEAGGPTRVWTRLRNRWELGHLVRAATATAAFILLLLATSKGG
ncbi:MAG: DUF1772 domain-containing protein [Sphingomonas sp.]|nr:DUF1772 domain-containing protein [Sphingomonas sp.]